LERCFKLLIKEKAGLDEQTHGAKRPIPSTFEEEISFLDAYSVSELKSYMYCYWQMRKDFLDYLEDFVTQDSLIGLYN
jgi:hypothetical protein